MKHLYTVLKRDVLLYVVFFTGAVVLAVEVMAVRILAPFFGNTIFSFSSVVSVILMALSIGYWHGGRLADKHPEETYFYRLVSFAGWSVIVAQFASLFILPLLSYAFSIIFGPLVATCVLFFVPSYLFGLLSPFVIKLRSEALPEQGVGQVSGAVFFSSTLGSILGSLGSGFILIPYIGISMSMYMMGVLVLVIGEIGRRYKKKLDLVDVFFYGVFFTMGFVSMGNINELIAATAVGDVQFVKDGLYERVMVVDKEMQGKNVRVLQLDRSFSSGITLPDGELLFPYTLYYRLYSYFHDASELSHALVLGAGTGTVASKIREDYTEAVVDTVDIEPTLFTLAHEFFMAPQDENVHEYVADGRQFLRNTDQRYGMIFGDIYSSLYSLPFHVLTEEYYTLVYNHLEDGGVYIGNYICALDSEPPSLLGSILHTLSGVFDSVYVFAVESPTKTTTQNIIVVATRGKDMQEITSEGLRMSSDSMVRGFADNYVDFDSRFLPSFDIFTDNLAPVELRIAELLRETDL